MYHSAKSKPSLPVWWRLITYPPVRGDYAYNITGITILGMGSAIMRMMNQVLRQARSGVASIDEKGRS